MLDGGIRETGEGMRIRQAAPALGVVVDVDLRCPLTVTYGSNHRPDGVLGSSAASFHGPHRTTGAAILGVWEQHTDAILPLDPAASTALIEELCAHLYRPEHTYVHRWLPGDLLGWDNHALQHGRPDVGVEQPRTLRRVVVGRPQDLSLFTGARGT